MSDERQILEQLDRLLRQHIDAQSELLERLLRAHLEAQHRLVDRLLTQIEQLLAAAPPRPAPPSPPPPRPH
jgi:uncharacterized membrane protein YccC